MITIIRIEHPSDGQGLWRSGDEDCLISNHSKFTEITERHSDKSKFPTYGNDEVLHTQIDWYTLQKYHFAFLNLEQFREALTNEEVKECINDLEFQVLMLDVTDYYTSSYQAVFNKESIISSKDISFMFI